MRINRVMGRGHVKHELYVDILDKDIKCRKQKKRKARFLVMIMNRAGKTGFGVSLCTTMHYLLCPTYSHVTHSIQYPERFIFLAFASKWTFFFGRKIQTCNSVLQVLHLNWHQLDMENNKGDRG